MPLDNSGYIAPEAIDWSGLTNGLSKTIYDIGNNRAIRKKELDDQFTDLDKQFRQAKVPANQTLGNLFLNITDAGVNKAYELNQALKKGQLSETDYRRIMNNMNDSFKGTINSVATLDTRIKEMVERQGADGDGGAFEVDLNKITGSLMELQGKTGAIDIDGFIKIGKVDPETGEITQMYDPEVINKPENVKADKYRLRDNVAKTVKQWQPLEEWKSTYRNGWVSIDSIKNKPEYKEGIETLAQSLANKSNPRNIYSILADNAGVALTTYQTDAEKNQKIKEQTDKLINTKKSAGTWDPKVGLTEKEVKDIENNMVKIHSDDAFVFQPEMTEEQIKRAIDFTKREIELQVETDMKGEAPTVWQPRAQEGASAGDREYERKRAAAVDMYKRLGQTWNQGDRNKAAAELTALSGGQTIFSPNPKGNGFIAKDAKTKLDKGTATTISDLSTFFMPGESSTDKLEFFETAAEDVRYGIEGNTTQLNRRDPINWNYIDKIVNLKGEKITKEQSGMIGRKIKRALEQSSDPQKDRDQIYFDAVDDVLGKKSKSSKPSGKKPRTQSQGESGEDREASIQATMKANPDRTRDEVMIALGYK
jgi:hypothetical protein